MKDLILDSIISAIIGLLLPYTIKVIKYIYQRTKHDNLCSQWYSYSLMTDNSCPKIFEGLVEINKGIFSLYKTTLYENGLTYRGTIQIENNHLLMIQSTSIESRKETSCIRLDYSAYNMRNNLHGYWLLYDSDNQISCATIILSKDKLTQEEAMQEMKSVSVNFENLLLRLSRGR